MLINNALIHTNTYRTKASNATIIITHGIAEHAGRFDDFAKHLNDNGYDVISYDIRGHGQSQGKRGAISSYKTFLKDLNKIVVKEKRHAKNIFLFGHSLGGVITNLYALEYGNVNGTIIASSPTNYVKGSKFLRGYVYKLLGKIKIKTDFSDPQLSHSAHNVNDPLNLQYFRLSLVGEVMIRGMKRLIKELPNYNVSTLVLQGKKDNIVTNEMTIAGFNKNGSKDKKLITYNNSMHDIIHDLEKKDVYQDVISWLGERI